MKWLPHSTNVMTLNPLDISAAELETWSMALQTWISILEV